MIGRPPGRRRRRTACRTVTFGPAPGGRGDPRPMWPSSETPPPTWPGTPPTCYPVSSVFDFITFGVMLWGFHADPALFRSGWFVESLATQTLVIFAIRTRRIPFFRSRPSVPLLLAALAVVAVGAVLPASPFGA